MKLRSHVAVTRLESLDDSRVSDELWNRLLSAGESQVVFLTRAWQRAWWKTFHPGPLLLLLAERDGEPVALAPLFSLGGMAFFVGSGGSDYLDFLGDISDEDVLDALLDEARRHIDAFVGFRFHHIPAGSATAERLAGAAERLGLRAFHEGSIAAPFLEMGENGAEAIAASNKKSLVRHDRYFQREGPLEVRHLREAAEVLPYLDAFFDQHVARWETTEFPSLFLERAQREFYELLVEEGAAEGWLRFTVLECQGRPIAFHFGSCYAGRFLWYKPTFDIGLSKRSPGEVLLRHLLLAAVDEGARIFDFGLGDEAFKSRFASDETSVETWALYTPEAAGHSDGVSA